MMIQQYTCSLVNKMNNFFSQFQLFPLELHDANDDDATSKARQSKAKAKEGKGREIQNHSSRVRTLRF